MSNRVCESCGRTCGSIEECYKQQLRNEAAKSDIALPISPEQPVEACELTTDNLIYIMTLRIKSRCNIAEQEAEEIARYILDDIRPLLRVLDEGDDSLWRKLFFTVAKTLKCLPSSFVDDNGHVILAAEKAMMRESSSHFDGLKAAAIGYDCHKDEGHNIALQEAVCHYNAVASRELKLTDISRGQP